MAGDTDEGEADGETVNESEQDLDGDDGIDEAGEKFAGQNGVLFDQFGKIVESTGFDRLQIVSASGGCGCIVKAGVNAPMARVRKLKPRRTPR